MAQSGLRNAIASFRLVGDIPFWGKLCSQFVDGYICRGLPAGSIGFDRAGLSAAGSLEPQRIRLKDKF
jgi:hypothetical protein